MLKFITRIIGSKNDRELKRIRPLSERTNAFEADVSALSDDGLRAKTDEFRQRIRERTAAERAALDEILAQQRQATDGDTTEDPDDDAKGPRAQLEALDTALRAAENAVLDEILPEAFAVVREASRRTTGLRHFDVQFIGGIVLHEGQDRRDEDRRGQDPRRHRPALPERAHRPRRASGHRQRLPGAPRRAVDGAHLPPARPQRRGRSCTMRASSSTRPMSSRTTGCSTCARSSARTPTSPTSRTARITSSASTTCATT